MINFLFHTHNLPEDRTLKVVLKAIPTNVSEDEVSADLTYRGFDVKPVKRFGAKTRPIPICLAIIKKDQVASEIFELTSMFYTCILVEAYKKSGLSQCHNYQRFGHD